MVEILKVIQDNTALVVGAVTGLTTLGTGALKAWRVARRVSDQLSAMEALPAQMTAVVGDLNSIKAQLYPNGGSSLYDQVRALKQYNRATLNLQDTPAIEFDSAGRCIFINRAFAVFTARTVMDCEGDGWINCVCSEYRQELMVLWKNAIVTRSNFEFQTAMCVANGKFRHGEFSFSVSGDGWVGVFHSID